MLIGLGIQSKPNSYQFISFMLCIILLFRTNIPYLIWKSNYWIFWPTKIQIRRIQEDGLSFLDENPSTPILTAHLFHEVHCVEGPWMIYKYQLEIVIDLKKNRQICMLQNFHFSQGAILLLILLSQWMSKCLLPCRSCKIKIY